MDRKHWPYDDDKTGKPFISCDVLAQGDYSSAGDVGEANIRALKKHLGEEGEGSYLWHEELGHYGYHQLWLADTEDNRDIIKQLEEDYQVFDEEELSRVQDEWERKAWDDYGWADIKLDVHKDVLDDDDYAVWEQEVEDKVEALNNHKEGEGDSWLLECYYEAKGLANVYPTFEYDGACLHLDKMAEEFYDVTQAKLHPRIVHHPDQKLLPGITPCI
jgi:hypothetical protein